MSLGKPVRPPGHSGMSIPVAISAMNLSARATIELETWHDGVGAFAAYFDDLNASWSGWTGAKSWSDDGGTVRIEATHDGIGLVTLVLSARPSYGADWPGAWELRVVIPLEPGSLAPLAHEVRSLIENVE
jgi:uncharacterized protein DUF6228